jgi:HSP20 family molecular chaperone IbpA
MDTDNNFTKVNNKKKKDFVSYEKEISILQRRIYSPKVDLIEKDKYYLVRIELPGVDKNTIRIKLNDNQIVFISGSKTPDDVSVDDKIIYKESKFDNFTRRVKLPKKVFSNFEKKLDFSNGVLKLNFYKIETEKTETEKTETEDQTTTLEKNVFDFKNMDHNFSWADS